MTDILCRWLNQDVHLDKTITTDSFADDFSNGYLIGKVLNSHGFQNDFSSFSKGRSSEAKLGNFMRLESSLRSLDIPFDSSLIHNVMSGQKGAAAKLMYQIYVALNRKGPLTRHSLESNRPTAKVKLDSVQTGIFTQLLKMQTPRQVDLNFQELVEKYQEKQKQREELLAIQDRCEEEKLAEQRKQKCQEAILKQRLARGKQSEMYSRLKPIELVKTKTQKRKSSSSQSVDRLNEKKTTREANETIASIESFEASLANKRSSTVGSIRELSTDKTAVDYMIEIKKKVKEETKISKEREKSRRKVLMAQIVAIHEQEERNREQMLAERLTRQCLQEKRIATQLMQIRKEKDNIRNNRILRQKQYEEERNREFQQFLDREAIEGRRVREEQEVLYRAKHERRRQLLQDKAKQNYEKHYKICQGIMHQIIEMSTKITEYRILTQNLVPAKMMRDWKILFLAGKSLYESEQEQRGGGGGGGAVSEVVSVGSGESSLEDKREPDEILDNVDLHEYLNMTNEWTLPDDLTFTTSPNTILTYIVHRLLDLVNPPKAPPSPPPLPKFYIKGAFLGMPFTGKTSILQKLSTNYGICILTPTELVKKAVETYMTEISAATASTTTTSATDTATTGTVDNTGTADATSTGIATGTVDGTGTATNGTADATTGTGTVDSTTGITTGTADGTGIATVEGAESTVPTDDDLTYPVELSELGLLGEQVYSVTVSGESVDDSTLVDIIIHKIKSLPDGIGWMLDNFPTTEEQARLLTIGLTGQEASDLKEQSHAAQLRSQNFLLIPEREVKEEELLNLSAVCGLDIVVHFSATPENIFKRSVLQKEDVIGKPDIQQSLLSFDAEWPKLKKWYHKYRTLHTVNANQDYDELYTEVEDLIESKLSKAKQNETMKKFGLQVNEKLLVSKSFSRMNVLGSPSATSMTAPPITKPAATSLAPPNNKKPKGRVRRPSSAGSTPNKVKKTRKTGVVDQQTVILSAESELFHLLDVNVEPGQDGWHYCNMPVNGELVFSLAERWPAAEKMFRVLFCDVFRCLRQERDLICHYIYNKRTEFAYYLKRPDCKQQLVTQWQKDFNQISTELRQQDLIKAELHQRVDDLSEKLWELCDNRKVESEKERQLIKDDQWLPDHVGLISNHYISLMQAELTKFQDAVLLIKDYYMSMTNATPQSLPDINTRLSLIELPMYAGGGSTGSGGNLSGAEELNETQKEEQENEKSQPVLDEEENCVPLMPREPPPAPDAAAAEDTAKTKKKSTVDTPPAVSPYVIELTELHLDHQLVVHAYNTALTISYKMLNSELRLIEEAAAEAEKPPPSATPPAPEKEQQKPTGKKGGKSPVGKGKSPKGKKGQLEPEKVETPVPVIVAPSPEELAKKQKMDFMRREQTAALKHEEKTLNNRLMLIKTKALEFIDYIKNKANMTYDEMEQWLIAYYEQEIESINQLSEVLHCTIEHETKLLSELTLPGPEFKINQGVNFYHPTPPQSPPPVLETTHYIQFTTNQLLSLIVHFRLCTTSNTLSISSLVTILETLINKTIGQNVFPNVWKDLTHEQILTIIECIYGKTIDLIDWRQLILCLTQPYPLPSLNDLLLAQQQYSTCSTHYNINSETYNGVSLWLEDNVKDERDRRIKMLLFELFKEVNTETINYQELLLFLSANPNISEGFLNALSVLLNQPLTQDSTTDIPLEAFDKILTHGIVSDGLYNLEGLYSDIGGEHTTSVPLNILLQHPGVVKLINKCNQYHLPDIAMLILARPPSVEPHPPTSDP